MRWLEHMKLREKAGRLKQAALEFFAGRQRLGPRWWSFAGLHRSTATRREAGAWVRRLSEEKNSLLSLVSGMEAEFLATGEGLRRLAQQVNTIQQESQSLTDLTLGQTQDAAIQFAFQLLKKAEDLVLASYDQYDHVFATFAELQQRLARLAKQHGELMRVLLPLNFITTTLRIEASRHPAEVQEVFFTLAASVNRMVNDVRLSLERQFEELAASERITGNLMQQVIASTHQHRKEVTATLATSRQQLLTLNEDLARAGVGAENLALLTQAVRRHMSGIVMAQQCQDIARQKIDHVGEAMDEMSAHLGETGPTTSAAEVETRQFVFRAAQIQLQQVQHVFDELNRAADSLKSGIQGLRADAGSASEAALKVGGTMLDAKVASQCQAGIGGTLVIIKQAVQKTADILAAFEPLQAQFVNCTNQATALAGDVRHAALNAQIFAIHAPDGATLEVLAGRMRVISDETVQHVAELGGALQHTAEMVNNLQQRLEDFRQLGQAEQETLNEEAALSQKKLSDLEGAFPVIIERIVQQQGTLTQSVEAILVNIRFPAAVAEASARSIGFFQQMVTWGGEGGEEFEGESAASRKIEKLKSNYTMASERHVHASALQPTLAVAGPTAPHAAVELFDEWEAPQLATVDAPDESALQGDRTDVQATPADLVASETIAAEAEPIPAPKTTAVTADLGANVELF